MKPSKSFLRQRKASSATESKGDAAELPQDDRERREEVVWGKTPGGEGIAIQSFLHAVYSLCYSLSRTDDTRRPDYPLPSGIPKESS
jgi:hypothetical protein